MPASPARKSAPAASKSKPAAKAATPVKTAKAGTAAPAAVGKSEAKPSAKNKEAKKAAPKQATPKQDAPKTKLKKPKMVRDSFTMPEPEYKVLGEVKRACLKAGIDVKKSELLRAGVALLQKLQVEDLKATLGGLMPLKAGRPKTVK